MTGPQGTSVTAQALIALRNAVVENGRTDIPTSALSGGFAIKKRGQGQVNADSRAYMQGDDIRYLDRGATARTGTLHVRTFHEERDRVTFLVADFRPSMLWGMRRAFRSVAAAEVLAWLGWQAIETGGRVGLMAVTAGEPVIVRTRGGTRGMLAVIGGLVRAHDAAMAAALKDAALAQRAGAAGPRLDDALAGLHRIVPRGASVVVASAFDDLGDGFEGVIGHLSQHRGPQFALIKEDALQDLPPGHYPMRGSDGRRRTAKFRKVVGTPDVAHILKDHSVIRIDAGLPPREAMIQAGQT